MPQGYITEKRSEPRMLCADLVRLEWKDSSGRTRSAVANLEDISVSGACVQLEAPLAKGTALRLIAAPKVLRGKTTYCLARDDGYYVGLRFAAGSKWEKRRFRPRYLFDPRVLIIHNLDRPQDPGSGPRESAN
jgi:hypothetical protein